MSRSIAPCTSFSSLGSTGALGRRLCSKSKPGWSRIPCCAAQAKAELSADAAVSEQARLQKLDQALVNGKDHSPFDVNVAPKVNGARVNGHPRLEDSGSNQQSISEFLEGKTLLITGATGFLAKVLVEKILREQPKVGHIYLVIQPRPDLSAEKRLESQVLTSQAFELLRQTHSEEYSSFMLSKISAVSGNMSEALLGMDQAIYSDLQDKVDVVVNSAATTTFDERYDVAMAINTLGPQRVIEFAKGSKRIQLVLHVSTAFTNGMRVGITPEKPFVMGDSITKEMTGHSWLPGVQVDDEIKLIEETLLAAREAAKGMKGEKADLLVQKKMVDLGMQRAQRYGWQDTYVFTKAMGEMLVSKLRGELPVAIVRPSIVESALCEPLQGWMEGIRMADPILLAYGKGQMDGFLADTNAPLDVVPVDCVINAMLAMLPKHAKQPSLTVYHVATSVCNPLFNWGVSKAATEHFARFPMMGKDKQPIRNPPMYLFPSTYLFQFHMVLKYQLPLLLEKFVGSFDNSNRTTNLAKKRNSLMLKTFDQLTYLAQLYQPYTFYKGRFDATNTMRLFNELSEEEKEKFNFDLTRINWQDYLVQTHLPGLRKFVLKGRGSTP